MARTVSAVQTRTDTTKTLLYKVPPKNTGLWSMMYIISLTGNETPKVYWYDADNAIEYFVAGGKNLVAGDYILLSDAHVALKENDEIRVQNTGTNSVTYIATIELRPKETTQFHG
jgi:hypothetical protein